MNQRLKAYLDKCGREEVDENLLDDLRKRLEEAVPKISENIRKREKLAAKLRISASKMAESEE